MLQFVNEDTDLRSRSAMPLTRFWVYWTTSENRKAKAEAETSAVRVLLRFLSYMFGLTPGLGVVRVVLMDGAEGREKRVDDAAGERWSADARDDEDRTEKRGCG